LILLSRNSFGILRIESNPTEHAPGLNLVEPAEIVQKRDPWERLDYPPAGPNLASRSDDANHYANRPPPILVFSARDAAPALARLYGDRPLKPDEPLNIELLVKPLFAERQHSKWNGEIQQLSPAQVSIDLITQRPAT
jgi:hypothetical protein